MMQPAEVAERLKIAEAARRCLPVGAVAASRAALGASMID